MKKIKQLIIKLFGIKFFDFLFRIYKKIKYKISRLKLGKYHTFNNFCEISLKNKNLFFGYYEKQPFLKNGQKILCMATNKRLSVYRDGGLAELMIYDLEIREFRKIGETNVWNTQMGCRLSWFDEENNLIIYNDLVNGNYGTIIKDIKQDKIIRKLPLAMYDISKNKDYILSLNFSRLESLRSGYGYVKIKDKSQNQNILKKDGIYIYNLKEDKEDVLITIEEIVKLKYQETMKDSKHYLNHISCNKYDNNSFMFFHLWQNKKGRYSRAIYYNIETGNLKVLNKGRMVSHYDWKSKDEILIYSGENNKNRFHLYNLKEDKIETIGDEIIKKDGHQTYFKDKNYILLDTYPNKDNFQELFIFDIKNNKKIQLGKILDYPQKDNSFRTDLHPRLSKDEKKFCIDCNYDGLRKIIVGEI